MGWVYETAIGCTGTCSAGTPFFTDLVGPMLPDCQPLPCCMPAMGCAPFPAPE